MRPQFKSPRVIIEVRPGALGQIWHPPEQRYLSSDLRLEWPVDGAIIQACMFLYISNCLSRQITTKIRKEVKKRDKLKELCWDEI